MGNPEYLEINDCLLQEIERRGQRKELPPAERSPWLPTTTCICPDIPALSNEPRRNSKGPGPGPQAPVFFRETIP